MLGVCFINELFFTKTKIGRSGNKPDSLCLQYLRAGLFFLFGLLEPLCEKRAAFHNVEIIPAGSFPTPHHGQACRVIALCNILQNNIPCFSS
jgi:hypothetical protein